METEHRMPIIGDSTILRGLVMCLLAVKFSDGWRSDGQSISLRLGQDYDALRK